MPSKSRSKKQRKTKEPARNWLDLPLELMINILFRVGVFDILENAQKVCTTWRKICKNEPTLWRVIDMNNDTWCPGYVQKMCKTAVDRSQGQLVDITMVNFCDEELLEYIADRSSKLRRLEIAYSYWSFYGVVNSWTKVLMKFPLLEELSLCQTEISKEGIEIAGRYCRTLKTFKMNQACGMTGDENAIAIGENLPQLRHLELTWNSLSNIGLQVILDGCRRLESLDLRMCPNIDLRGEIGRRCSTQIKCLKLGDIEEFPFNESDYYVDDSMFWWDDGQFWWDNDHIWFDINDQFWW